MRYSGLAGIIAAAVLVIACFLPWAYYPDLHQTFTGFFSAQNYYGKPGKLFVFFAVAAVVLFAIPKLWAKRFNMVITVLTFAYGVKTYLLYSACYQGTCPDKKEGLFLILFTPVIMVLAAVLPDLKLKDQQ